jgi:hypothetical protein
MGLFKAIKKVAGVVGKVAGIAGVVTGNPVLAKVGQVGSAIGSLGGSGGGGSSTTSTQQGNIASGAYYDPFGASRGIYATKLNTLMNDPAEAARMVKSSIPYTEGMASGERALRANLARTGQVQSGAEQIAFGNLGQDFFTKSYQDLYNQYSTLSGATQAPLSMASANQLGASQGRLQDQAWGQAIGAIGDIFTSTSGNGTSGGGTIMNSAPSNYSPGATSYAPMNTNIGMGNYQGPANMGGGLVGPNWGSS